MTVDQMAETAHLNPKYLRLLWQTLTEGEAVAAAVDDSGRLANLCARRTPKPVADRIRTWQGLVWKFDRIGSYVKPAWQVGTEPNLLDRANAEAEAETAAGAKRSRALSGGARREPGRRPAQVVWQRPRFEAAGRPPILLRDLRQVGGRFEAVHRTLFAEHAKYLAASLELARDADADAQTVAEKHGTRSGSAQTLERTGGFVDGNGDAGTVVQAGRQLARPADGHRLG